MADGCAEGLTERLSKAMARAHASGALAGMDLVSLGTNTHGLKRRLAMAITLGHGEGKRSPCRYDGTVPLTTISKSEREIIQRGGTRALVG
jgi:hypothetical protein